MKPSAEDRAGVGVLLLLVGALLACGSGGKSSKNCEATVTHQGKAAQGKGGDRQEASHAACRAWCKANDPPSADSSHMQAGCASRCGGDVMFGKSQANVSCK